MFWETINVPITAVIMQGHFLYWNASIIPKSLLFSRLGFISKTIQLLLQSISSSFGDWRWDDTWSWKGPVPRDISWNDKLSWVNWTASRTVNEATKWSSLGRSTSKSRTPWDNHRMTWGCPGCLHLCGISSVCGICGNGGWWGWHGSC